MRIFVQNIKVVSNLDRFIHRGMVDYITSMVDRTSLIWSGRNLCRFIVRAWLTERQDMKMDIFTIQSTCLEISVSILFVIHEPPYKTTVVVLQSRFSP